MSELRTASRLIATKHVLMQRGRFVRLSAMVATIVLCQAAFLGMGQVAAVEAGRASDRPTPKPAAWSVVVDATRLNWHAGQRLKISSEDAVLTPDGQKAILVNISGPPSPDNRYSEEFSLIAKGLQAQLSTVDPAAWVSKMRVWLNVLKPASEPLIFVIRKGHGDHVPLEPAGWREVELRNWGADRLMASELEKIAIRAALPADGSQFLLGPLTVEFTDEATEAAKWTPANSKAFTINGLWWLKENGGAYRRLPHRPAATDQIEKRVWNYSNYPAGARLRFKTDSSSIELRIDHGGDPFSWKELSVTAMAGIELYEGPPDQMVFRRISRPVSGKARYVADFGPFPDRELREFTFYLPMYAKLKSLDIAMDSDARIEPPSPFKVDKPIVFYGTSFIQGGCASRPSMNLPALIGRMLGVDVVNLGFAGDGRCEQAMAKLIAEIDAACFVMGPILNEPVLMQKNYPRFVACIRQQRPDVPILLMTRLHTSGQTEPYGVNTLVRDVWQKMCLAGDSHVHFFDSFILYRDGSIHPTVEGLHPSDLGFKMIADALAPDMAKILELSAP